MKYVSLAKLEGHEVSTVEIILKDVFKQLLNYVTIM